MSWRSEDVFATLRRNFYSLPNILPNILFMDELNSTVESNLRSPTLPDVFMRLTEAKLQLRRHHSRNSRNGGRFGRESRPYLS